MVTKVKNPSIDLSGDTSGIVMPSGTTAQRPSAAEGLLRYNSTLKRLEQSDGSDFETIALPPSISSLSGNYNEDNDTTITINGTNFMTGATVTFLNNADDSSLGTSPTVSRVSSTQLTAVTGFASSPIATTVTAIKVKVTNPTGQNAESTTTISAVGDPSFRNDAGSLGTIYDSGRAAGGVYDAGADSNDSVAIYHNITSGSIPAGMSFNNDNGDISGTPDAVGSDTTSNFTVTAIVQSADSAIRTESRAFSLTVKAPSVTSVTAAGAFTFTAPFTGNYEVLVVGGGAGGGSSAGGGGGGLVYKASHPLSAGGIPGSVGAGGGSNQNGGDTTFSNITARGGGRTNANGGANTGGAHPQGTQSGCQSNPYTTTQGNVADGGTSHGGNRGGGYRDGHYFWGGGGGGGSGGNGSEPHGCPGNCNGGVGVEISEFSTFGESGFFGGGGNGSQQRYDPVNPSGGSGTDGNGNGAAGTGGGGASSGRTGGVYVRF